MEAITMEFTPMEHATMVSLVALGIAVMQNDEERGKEHITVLSQPGVQAAAEALIGKLVKPLEPVMEEPPAGRLIS
jgi:hypothetical protein